MPEPSTPHKQAAVQFLKLVVAGNFDDAFGKYVDMKGKHHNPFFEAGFLALQKAMADNHAQFPNKQINVKHVLEDGELVSVHSQLVLAPGKDVMNVVHLFRFSSNKVVEMWDCGQTVPANSPNKDGAF